MLISALFGQFFLHLIAGVFTCFIGPKCIWIKKLQAWSDSHFSLFDGFSTSLGYYTFVFFLNSDSIPNRTHRKRDGVGWFGAHEVPYAVAKL